MKSMLSRPTAALLFTTILGCGSCIEDGNGTFTNEKDAGPAVLPGVTAEDIGTLCYFDYGNPSQNPSNTCTKSALSCVIATADAPYRTYGHFLYEAIPLFSRFLGDIDEGICTLVSGPGQPPPACPLGTALVPLSTGHIICMRLCETSMQCGRDGYVCDYRFMDSSTYDPQTGQVSPWPHKVCVPGCQTDLPYCVRTFITASGEFHVSDEDMLGYRQCNHTSGECEEIAVKGDRYVGDQCQASVECRDGLICLDGWLFSAPEEHGFCARWCNPDINLEAPDNGCDIGEGCEMFLGIGYCFPNCTGGVCGGTNQVCAKADPARAGLPAEGPPEDTEWKERRCIPCELSSFACSTPTDAGVPTDAESGDSTGVDAGGSDTGGSDASGVDAVGADSGSSDAI